LPIPYYLLPTLPDRRRSGYPLKA